MTADSRDLLYRLIVENAHEGICVIDAKAHLTYVNAPMAEMLGYAPGELIGRDGFEFVAAEQQDDARRQFAALTERQIENYELTVRRRSGEEASLLVNVTALRDGAGTFVGGLAMVADITARKRLEHEIQLSDRLESVGRLASGVAHDFKNLLTAILGFADLASSRLPEDHPAQGDLHEVRQASERAVGLTQQLLAFGRKQILHPHVLDINEAIADVLRLAPGILPHSIVVSTRLAPDLRPAYVDPTQLQQGLLNLIMNARDAMRSGGSLQIATANVALQEAPIPGAMFRPGDYVKITVQDTGVGMTGEVREQVFEPFFTTKERGSGLGLASVYGFVKQSKGFITVDSAPAKGATFTIFLPAHGVSHKDDEGATKSTKISKRLP